MRVYFKQIPIPTVVAESLTEANRLANINLKTKVAYREQSLVENPNWKLCTVNPAGPRVDFDRCELALFNELTDIYQFSYLLRVGIDFCAVQEGCLPLHAGAVITSEKAMFIFGGTKHGKSTVIHSLSQVQDIQEAGDDHVICRNGAIFGNQARRIRTQDGLRETVFEAAKPLCHFGEYSITIVDLGASNNYSKFDKDRLITDRTIHKVATKYLTEPLKIKDHSMQISDLFGEDFVDKYLSNFAAFVNGAQTVRIASGTLEFIVQSIIEGEPCSTIQ